MKPFQIRKYDRLDKRIQVDGPGDLTLYVDYDDVDHAQVLRDLRKAVALLNRHPDCLRFG